MSKEKLSRKSRHPNYILLICKRSGNKDIKAETLYKIMTFSFKALLHCILHLVWSIKFIRWTYDHNKIDFLIFIRIVSKTMRNCSSYQKTVFWHFRSKLRCFVSIKNIVNIENLYGDRSDSSIVHIKVVARNLTKQIKKTVLENFLNWLL